MRGGASEDLTDSLYFKSRAGDYALIIVVLFNREVPENCRVWPVCKVGSVLGI